MEIVQESYLAGIQAIATVNKTASKVKVDSSLNELLKKDAKNIIIGKASFGTLNKYIKTNISVKDIDDAIEYSDKLLNKILNDADSKISVSDRNALIKKSKLVNDAIRKLRDSRNSFNTNLKENLDIVNILITEGSLKDTADIFAINSQLKKLNINTTDARNLTLADMRKMMFTGTFLIPILGRFFKSNVPESERQEFINRVESLITKLKEEVRENKGNKLTPSIAAKIHKRVAKIESMIEKYRTKKNKYL